MESYNRSNQATEGISLKSRLLAVPTIISFAVAAVLILLLVRGFRLDAGETIGKLREANPFIYGIALLLYYLSFFIRGFRWRLFLKNAQVDKEIPAGLPNMLVCSQFVLLGWFANTISWFRMGDAYRSYLLKERYGASFPKTFGTILAEHAVDVLALICLLLVALALLAGSPGLEGTRGIIWAAMGLALAVVIGLLFLRFLSPKVARLLPQRLEVILSRVQEGVTGSLGRLPAIALISALIWASEAFRIFLVTQALGFTVGIPIILFVALTHALLIIVPLTPAGLGIVETGMAGVLSLVLAREDAVSVAILDRSITYGSVILVGVLLFSGRQVWTLLGRRWGSSPHKALKG